MNNAEASASLLDPAMLPAILKHDSDDSSDDEAYDLEAFVLPRSTPLDDLYRGRG